MSLNFSLIAGDSVTLEVTVVDEAGVVSDISGTTISWTAASAPFGTAIITKSGSIIDGPAGRFDVLLVQADTELLNGNLYHQALITAGDGSQTTIFLGLLTISPLSSLNSVELFRVRYPEFSSVSTALISLVLDEAMSDIGSGWLEKDRVRAQLLLTAHKLSIEGEPRRSQNGVGTGASGPVKRRKVGDVETEFAGVNSGTGASSFGGFGGSTYGQEYFRLMRLNFPSTMVF